MLNKKINQNQNSSRRLVLNCSDLVPQGHLARTGDIFDCHTGVREAPKLAEVKEAAKYPEVHKTVPYHKEV